jgi:predicted enzyme related to lactoylglutathione lyase
MSRVAHFEIHASEPARLIEFYTSLFGWQFKTWGPSSYWLIDTAPGVDPAHAPPGINGGLVPRRGGSPVDGQPVGAFVCTVSVDDAAVSLARIVELGGSVALPRMAIPGVGWLGYGKDPDGNIFGVMQPDESAA